MRKSILLILVASWIVACNNKSNENTFTVNGTIANNSAKMVYLEEVPAARMQSTIVDSMKIPSNGKFTLKSSAKETVVMNIRLDMDQYPVASIINDVPAVDVDIKISQQNNHLAEDYNVSKSPASKQIRDFTVTFNGDLQKLFINVMMLDSLKRAGTPDSGMAGLMDEHKVLSDRIKSYSEEAFKKAVDPTVLLFELGYYQGTANGAGYGLEGFSNQEVKTLIGDATKKFPEHQGAASVYKSLVEEEEKAMAASWIGKQAPDFTMPDVNGKDVSLSSFKGKYVLIDFWASWCGPCRQENPNVVVAYNKFKDKNFTVLGVSLDRPGQKEKWLKAIKDDGLTWTHVSDLQYWNSSVVAMYNFNGIPFNVLIDPTGKVIGESLRGRNLEAKLAEVLH